MSINEVSSLHRFIREPRHRPYLPLWLPAAAISLAVTLVQALPLYALDCLPEQQDLVKIPELISKDGKLRGTILLGDEQQRLTFRQPPATKPGEGTINCFPQYVRVFRGINAVPPPPANAGDYPDPLPGPTLRARVGDLIELTFLNHINPSDFGDSIDRGDSAKGSGCDETSAGYPGKPGDLFPNCFHGSSTANIHFHGTHTNPNSTGDNVFIEVRPSLRVADKAVVTEASVHQSFTKFFARCESELKPTDLLRQWPTTWSDLPTTYTASQMRLLKKYDKTPGIKKKLWPANWKQLKEGAWPQYYIGAFPYCFRLPEYTETAWPPQPAPAVAHDATHTDGAGTAEREESASRGPLMMGQAPGTHWYHAHKHGSTAINVSNGMTGAFVIEGKYDDELNDYYGASWTRKQPVMVINQLGVTPNLERGGTGRAGGKGPNFSVNGRLDPLVRMKPGEVQMWRIVNTSSIAGVHFSPPQDGFQWMQLAQDGVQFNDTNYKKSLNKPFLLASGNRADLLVKAPTKPAATCKDPQSCTYPIMVKHEVDPSDLATANKVPLVSVNVSGSAPEMELIPKAPSFPPFLIDITRAEVKGTKKIVFASNGPNHTIDGKKFDGEVGEVVLLNTVEEWKVVNEATNISHPFHIHINPFQVVEVFAPNDTVIDPAGKLVPKYTFAKDGLVPGQCSLDINANPDDWKPCDSSSTQKDLIWWDVFPIPSGTDLPDPRDPDKKKTIKVPGYFKMRSRFVDYTGYYVIHCHILAHEDRGMMTIVEVAPLQSPYSHH
jgi:FtsP/CotA-like multicopper oxidase with cupredoxin domain